MNAPIAKEILSTVAPITPTGAQAAKPFAAKAQAGKLAAKPVLTGIRWSVGIVGLLFLLSGLVWLFWAARVLPADAPLPLLLLLLLLVSYYATALVGVFASALTITSLPGSDCLGLPSR